MKISKKLTAVLVTLGVVGMGVMAHAAPPVGKTVLQTYSCKRVNDCYTGLGTGKTGWIAAHDDLIRLYEIRSDGWVRGDYPAGSGRVTRWFRFGDLVMNGNFQNYEANLVNVKTAPVYRTHNSGSSFGTVYNTDKVIVVDEYGSRKCIVYNLDAGGYKMGWVDKNKVVARGNNPISLQPASPAVGWYYLESVWKPGYVIAVNSNNNNVCVQKQTDASMQANMDRRGIKSNQKWYLSRNGNSYLLRNEANNLYMNLSGSGFSNERNINAVARANSRSLFNFFTYGGYYFLQPNGGGNYVLDLYGGNNMAYRDNIQIYGASGGVNQAWKLVKVTNPSPQPQPKPQPVDVTETKAYWDSKKNQQVANLGKTDCYSRSYRTEYFPHLGRNVTFPVNGVTHVFKKTYDGNDGVHSTNCTWYAWGRMKEVTGAELLFNGSANAGEWANNVNKTYFWVDGSVTSKCVAVRPTRLRGGHVAFVEYFDKATQTVYFTEANVDNSTDLKVKSLSLWDFENKRGFENYIHRK